MKSTVAGPIVALLVGVFAAQLRLEGASVPISRDWRRPALSSDDERLVAAWQINNPNQHGVALRGAQALEEKAARLQREGEVLQQTRDHTSALTGEREDRTLYRERGSSMVEQARADRATAARIRTLVSESLRELEHMANFPLSPMIEFRNLQGKSLRAVVVGFSGTEAIVRRDDGGFFQVSMQNISASYAPLFDMIRVSEFGRKAKKLAPYVAAGKSGDVLFTDVQSVWIRSNSGEVEQLENLEQRDVGRELTDNLVQARNEEKAASIEAGTVVSFQLERMLDFGNFPDLVHLGRGLYQVSINRTRALLVTQEKAYFSRGMGAIRVVGNGNATVVLVSGATETVPVMVEASKAAVTAFEEKVRAREACDRLLQDYERNRKLFGDLILVPVGASSPRSGLQPRGRAVVPANPTPR